VGIVKAYAGTTTPANYLPCDGAAVSRTDYAALFGAIGTTYGAGDGSTTFNVPDYREAVLVGIGQSTRAAIAAHDVYTLGEFKDDQMQSHQHKHNLYCDGSNGNAWSYRTGVSNYWLNEDKTDTNDGRSGTTTHGKQVGVNYIIKYQ
jgi:microcystin-dependent protein